MSGVCRSAVARRFGRGIVGAELLDPLDPLPSDARELTVRVLLHVVLASDCSVVPVAKLSGDVLRREAHVRHQRRAEVAELVEVHVGEPDRHANGVPVVVKTGLAEVDAVLRREPVPVINGSGKRSQGRGRLWKQHHLVVVAHLRFREAAELLVPGVDDLDPTILEAHMRRSKGE